MATVQNQTILTDLVANNPPSESKPFQESPAGHYCPICNRKCPTNLCLFNAHIDKCLLSGENSRPTRKRLSPTLNEDFLTENIAQNLTPLKTRKKQRGRPSKKMAQITLDTASLQESIITECTSGDQEENLGVMDIAVKKSNEEELSIQLSPKFAQSSEFKFSFPETEEIRENSCTEMKQKTSSKIGKDSADKNATFSCSVSGSGKDQQSQTSCVSQYRSVINSTLSLNSAENHSVSVECLSSADLKTKNSQEDDLSDENYSTVESDKFSHSETDSLKILENTLNINLSEKPINRIDENNSGEKCPILENTSNINLSEKPINRIDENNSGEKCPILENTSNINLSEKPINRINENNSGEKCPILESLKDSKSTSQNPKVQVLSVPVALSLKEQNKKNWLEMLQKCAKNAAEVDNEKQSIKIKKNETKPDSISPAKKKSSSNHAGKEKSKSARSLLQYFHPTGAKPNDLTSEKNLGSVQQTDLSGIKIKQEPLSLESCPKSVHIPKNTTTLTVKEENTIPLPTDQIFSQINCDSSGNSSNKIHPLEHEELKSCQPEMVMSDGKNQKQFNHCDSQPDQTNVSNGFEEVGCKKEKLIPKETFPLSSEFADSKIMVKQSKAIILSTSPLSHYEQTVEAYNEKQQLHSDLSDKKIMPISMQQPLASPSYEEEDESESSSLENFSQPFQMPSYEEIDKELTCQSEKEPETSLQSEESLSFAESREDTDFVIGDIFTCPVCSKEVLASNMTVFNEHVDLCLNQGVIHNILIEQGTELRRTETMKR